MRRLSGGRRAAAAPRCRCHRLRPRAPPARVAERRPRFAHPVRGVGRGQLAPPSFDREPQFPDVSGAPPAYSGGRAGMSVPADEAPALDEGQASAGEQSPPAALLHPWKAAVALRLSRSMRLDAPTSRAGSPDRAAPIACLRYSVECGVPVLLCANCGSPRHSMLAGAAPIGAVIRRMRRLPAGGMVGSMTGAPYRAALITGATHGIGAATARRLGRLVEVLFVHGLEPRALSQGCSTIFALRAPRPSSSTFEPTSTVSPSSAAWSTRWPVVGRDSTCS
jgi:hypothetical protein